MWGIVGKFGEKVGKVVKKWWKCVKMLVNSVKWWQIVANPRGWEGLDGLDGRGRVGQCGKSVGKCGEGYK
jgi:hypothetical protein